MKKLKNFLKKLKQTNKKIKSKIKKIINTIKKFFSKYIKKIKKIIKKISKKINKLKTPVKKILKVIWKILKVLYKIFIVIFRIAKKLANLALLFIVVLMYYAVDWIIDTYGNLPVDELIFQISMPIGGTEEGLVNSFWGTNLKPTLLIVIPVWIVVTIIFDLVRRYNFIFKLKTDGNERTLRVKSIFVYVLLVVIELLILYIPVNTSLEKLHIREYIEKSKKESTFIQDNYVDPKSVNITFPKKKQNLIYIYSESLESSYFSRDLGGNEDYNLMSNITELTLNNINFSNTDKIGGGFASYGTTYTSGGLTGQTLGIPVKLDGSEVNNDYNHMSFLRGAYGLGNILEDNGYNQVFMIGSDKEFGNRNVLFRDHGNYTIYDYSSAIDEGKIDKNYRVWWGYEDEKLFEYSKEKILELSKSKKPFNFTMLTTGTHFPNGYAEESCPYIYDDPYSNAINCSMGRINEFVNWIQSQEFGKNTTIIISGDHLSMDTAHFANYGNYERTVYNLFINSKVTPVNTKNRKFNTLDMYPTTLAALGVKIEGDKLALGTNLFSNKKTLTEEYGMDYINEEFAKKSSYYNVNFILLKK